MAYTANMEFEWAAGKPVANLRKHHTSFEDAARVFLDPNRIEAYDGRDAYGEDRWKTDRHGQTSFARSRVHRTRQRW